MKEKEIYTKRAKTWNFFLIILTIITTLINLIGIPGTLNPQRSAYDTYEKAGLDADKMFQHANTLPVKLVFVIGLVLSIGLLISYFQANKKLKNKELPTKAPYLILIGWQAVNLLFNAFYNPTGMNLVASNGILSVVTMYLIACIPPFVVLYNLKQAEKSQGKLY